MISPILGGLPLGRFYPDLDDGWLVCVTESRTREEIDQQHPRLLPALRAQDVLARVDRGQDRGEIVGRPHDRHAGDAAVALPRIVVEEPSVATNGGGSVAGTKNNLPSGLTNSSVLTSASGDATTGIPAGTHDQITHVDVNVSGRDCNFCHTQAGVSTAAGVQGQEWAQAKFHVNFTSASPLVMNGTTGRCSSCHMNVKPGPGYPAFNHGALSATSGTQDCSSCHSWPGTGTPTAPNWLGAAAAPAIVTLTGWASGTSITRSISRPSGWNATGRVTIPTTGVMTNWVARVSVSSRSPSTSTASAGSLISSHASRSAVSTRDPSRVSTIPPGNANCPL